MNSIIKMFQDWGIKFEENLTCGNCGKNFMNHNDEDLEKCSLHE